MKTRDLLRARPGTVSAVFSGCNLIRKQTPLVTLTILQPAPAADLDQRRDEQQPHLGKERVPPTRHQRRRLSSAAGG
jgi:hypothetical protein